MTAAELYERDAGFRGFMQVWCDQRRCPLELTDYLLDRDMVRQAECCRWMYEGDSWEVISQDKASGILKSGRFPCRRFHGGCDMFPSFEPREELVRCHWLPFGSVSEVSIRGDSPTECILKVMDAWNPEAVVTNMSKPDTSVLPLRWWQRVKAVCQSRFIPKAINEESRIQWAWWATRLECESAAIAAYQPTEVPA